MNDQTSASSNLKNRLKQAFRKPPIPKGTENTHFVVAQNGLKPVLYSLNDPILRRVRDVCLANRLSVVPNACVLDAPLADEHVYVIYSSEYTQSWILTSLQIALQLNLIIAVEYYVYHERAYRRHDHYADVLEHAILEKKPVAVAAMLYS